MSDKPKFPRAQALAVGEYFVRELTPLCDRIVIAGSLRRGKAEVGDVEILYVPKYGIEQDGLFDTKEFSLADARINAWFKAGFIGKRLSSAGVSTWGEKNKLAIDGRSKIPIDFFSTTLENWWVSLVVRTGSKDTNLQLTTGAQRLNRTLHAYGSGVEIRSTGEHIAALSERDVFSLCNVPYKEPGQR